MIRFANGFRLVCPLCLLSVAHLASEAGEPSKDSTRSAFERKYAALKHRLDNDPISQMWSNGVRVDGNWSEYRELIAMGPVVIPMLIETLDRRHGFTIVLLRDLAKVRFEQAHDPKSWWKSREQLQANLEQDYSN